MTTANLTLPPGTSVMMCQSGLIITLEWQGHAGVHRVRLQQKLDWERASENDKVIADAVEVFRNIVGQEVADDARSTPEVVPSESDPVAGFFRNRG